MSHVSGLSTGVIVRLGYAALLCCVSCQPASDKSSSDGGATRSGSQGGDAGSVRGDSGPHAPYQPGDAGKRNAGDAGPSDAAIHANDKGSGDDAGLPMCAPTEHICRCLTAGYCLFGGAACVSPTRPCPSDHAVPACDPPCGEGSVCIRHQQIGGAFLPAGDGGVCPDQRVVVPEAPTSCSVPPTFTCMPIPAECHGVAHCACAATICDVTACDEHVAGQLDCLQLVP